MMGPEKITQVVAMCAMLHNEAMQRKIPLVPAGEYSA